MTPPVTQMESKSNDRMINELPEKKVFSEEEQKKVDELVSEFSFFLTAKHPEDPWKGLDSGNVF
jgi:hypothetical protein